MVAVTDLTKCCVHVYGLLQSQTPLKVDKRQFRVYTVRAKVDTRFTRWTVGVFGWLLLVVGGKLHVGNLWKWRTGSDESMRISYDGHCGMNKDRITAHS